ncbi:MAG: host attachment protein [Myxococcota bacterium]
MQWIIVADNGRARIFENDGEHPVTEVEGLIHPEARVPHRDVEHRWADEELEHFARTVAHRTRRGLDDGAFESLVLVAPPRFLGRLRHALDARVAGTVVQDLGKDYTRLKPRDLSVALEKAGVPL